ncbi:hypothetical protein Aconfl_18910 [Algoriphagus confluentis]|uniref:Uncharacterized protein n=1 Tax=Algoriphagus confluentis TaxID=1697556 RepID=A0ABQ6PMQ0_9BACT|nr:hypothetical protein Aconfl_18910 [Algoriphagus confluentis]
MAKSPKVGKLNEVCLTRGKGLGIAVEILFLEGPKGRIKKIGTVKRPRGRSLKSSIPNVENANNFIILCLMVV